jgi:YVTN family beta-propeller protein
VIIKKPYFRNQNYKMMKKVFATIATILMLVLMTAYVGSLNQVESAFQGVLIVSNKSGNDVHFIDRASGEVLAVLPTGTEPHEVEVSDDGKIAVVCNYGNREEPGNSLSVYDVASLTLITTIDLGKHTRPHGMQWINGTRHILVTAEGSQSLLVVDIESGKILKEIQTQEDVSHMVAATPDFKKAFVPSIRTGNIAVLNLETGKLTDHIYSGEGAEGIDVSPDGKEVWVTNRGENTITVFDAESMKKLATIPCADFPIRAKFTPDGSRFVVSNARSGDVAVFDVSSRQLIARVKMMPPPSATDQTRYFAEFEGTSIPIGLVVPDNNTVYVANTRSDVVTRIDLEKLEITGHFAAGKEPDGIGFSAVKPDKKQ